IRVVSTAGDVAVRSQAVAALSRANTAEGFRSVLAALPELESQARSTLEYQRARRAFLAAPRLADHQRFFEAEATRRDGARSAWADAALLVIADARGGPSEARTQAARALEAGWADPGRRVQLLHAVALAGHRPSGARVLASLSDPDPAVAAAAKAAAAELRLDAGPSGRPPGRRLGAMNPEAVIAAVVTRAGDRTLGEQVFTRLNCATCHTVKADEPPRGPFLGTIAATYKRGELAEAILRPSKTIAQGFATNLFALDDGTTLSGFVVREAADAVTVRTAEGAEVPIPTAQIEERRRLDTSVMPEGLVNDLTIREFASLLDYLQAPAK
ncbi:MAG TPA: c-type cytochrome, partial [Isosphaeraceae bacterium]